MGRQYREQQNCGWDLNPHSGLNEEEELGKGFSGSGNSRCKRP